LGILAGAVFTALVQSSSATIGLSVVMATQGLLSLPAGIAILFGAKIGTGITAILAAIGKPQDAKRAAAVHVLFNVLGALIWLPFIAQLAGLAEMISPAAAHLQGVERLVEEVPRQIANAATIWATANVVLFLPFAALFAKMAIKLVPDRTGEGKALIRPRFLDDELIRVPSMALERARMELGHMGELTEGMLAKVRSAFAAGDFSDLSRQHDQVVALREAVLAYLQQVGRSELSDAEADEHARLVAATVEIENMSAAIGRELAPLARTLKEAAITPSEETAALLERLFQAVQASAHSGLQALLENDERAAQAVVSSRDSILALTSELHRTQAARLAGDDPDRLLKHRVQIEILDKLRRVYTVAEHMALSVLPRGALVGELSL
jgi:phosphate:Na+ symporter